MAIPSKPSPNQPLNLDAELPNPPQIPEELIRRFPEMKNYQIQYWEWWITVKKRIGELTAQTAQVVNKIANSTE